jgi:hypothetical protein
MVLSQKFSPTERAGDDSVVIRNARHAFFTQPKLRKILKELVAEAESLRRELDAIDWDSDDDS